MDAEPATDSRFLPLIKQAIAGSFRFSGRARRSELLAYYIFQLLAGAAIMVVVGIFLDTDAEYAGGKGLELVLGIPLVALFVRRLHDINLRGWWVLPLVLGYAYQTTASYLGFTKGFEARHAFERALFPFEWALVVIVIGAWAVALIAGTAGPNRFGLDPRGPGSNDSGGEPKLSAAT